MEISNKIKQAFYMFYDNKYKSIIDDSFSRVCIISYSNPLNIDDPSKKEINYKYEIMFIKYIQNYLSKEDKSYFNNCLLNNKKPQSIHMISLDNFICGNYKNPCPLDSFNKHNEDLLNNPNTSTYLKDSIKRTREKFIQTISNDNNLKHISVSSIEDISNYRQYLSLKEDKEVIENSSEYEYISSIINRLSLKGKNTYYNAYNIKNSFVGLCPNIKRSDNSLFNTILISSSLTDDELIRVLIHELNHNIETKLLSYSDTTLEIECGFETIEEDLLSNTDKHRNIRKYEYFNEIINELITEDILSTYDPLNNKNNTLYEMLRFLTEEFYNTYKNQIIESRLTHNKESLLNVVGINNFESLNNLINSFMSHFSVSRYNNTLSDIHNNRQSNDVSLYTSYYNRAKDILTNMNLHNISAYTIK
ncbi:MAG: hypothetical protein RSB00_03130 [Bacilli bacterium]